MFHFRFRNKLAGLCIAAVAAAALTVALERWQASAAVAGMAYLVLVVWTAARMGLRRSLALAVLCAAAFDYFFLPPFRTLRILGAGGWAAFVWFLMASLVTGRLADRARSLSERADERRADVERLYELSQEMLLHEDPARLVSALPQLLAKIFALEAAALFIHDGGRLYVTGAETPAGMQATLATLPEELEQPAMIHGGFAALPLRMGLRKTGALAWRPNRLSQELAAAIAAQAAIALSRALAIERSSRLEAARTSERLRTALLDSLTHELRTPLTAIRAAATTLTGGEGLDAETERDLALVIDEEASHLDALIGEAVEMAQYDAQTVKVKLEPMDPQALLEQAVEASHKALAGHRVAIAPALAGEFSGEVWADAHLLGRVLHHLLENAARYTPAGSRIGLGSRCIDGRLEFRVEDDGPGIESQDLPFIFEKFYRGKRTTATRKGSGMGLAIVRAILTAHEGGIEVLSEPGQGAAFRFWVPLRMEKPETAGD